MQLQNYGFFDLQVFLASVIGLTEEQRKRYSSGFCERMLVRNGYARIATYPQNFKNVKLFQESEWEVRELKRGLWSNNLNCNKKLSILYLVEPRISCIDCQETII